MMAEKKKLSDLVQVGSRFGRSVNLERDFFEDVSLNGYVLTTTARSNLHRIGQSLTDTDSARAWTLTGPYGSGKSAFALFAAKTLSTDLRKDAQQARALVKDQDEALWKKIFGRGKTSILKRGLCPVLISGSREPIAKALLRGLVKSVKHFGPENQSFMLVEAEALLKSSDEGEVVPGRQIAEVFEQVAYEISKSRSHGNGLLIIVDELGKLLEYTAAHPYKSDIFVLQELAEIARRSKDNPILLLTILHQTFDHYVERLDRSQKEEWMKVQGRFEDAAFQEPTDQLLRILANAISLREAGHDIEPLKQHSQQLALEADELGIVPGALKEKEELEILEQCVPLHPTVALILGQVFRRLGQNERSLFAFLTSGEPYGFQEFLNNNFLNEDSVATLRLDHLYDYIVTALGSGLYVQSSGKKWAEIESALNRLPNPTSLQVRLIKTIGLLRTIGDIGNIKPSKEFLKFALADNQNSQEDVELALEQLQNRSIIIYRQHSDGFSLWEGSDVDIEDRLAEARAHVDPNESLASSMAKHFKPRPMIARCHSFRTGTLRFFEVRYTDRFGFEDALNESISDADGLILYAITFSNDEIADLAKKAKAYEMLDSPQTLIGIPLQTAGLREAVLEVACLKWVQENTPELEGDRTARRELDARFAQAEESVEKLLQSFLDSPVENSDRGGCAWYYKGERIEIHSERALQEFITGICDKVYEHTPVLHNELINRRHVSTSAAGARRALIESMLEHGNKESLGIEGFPPQLSLYYSLLQETGIHREENGQWGFFPPKQDADSGMKAVWKAMDDFFAETESGRLPVSELFDRLKEPPYGMKNGPLPILFCAALLHYDTEMAFYENGSFVPALSAAVSERLIKSPDKFQAQRYRIAGVRAELFERYATTLLQNPDRALTGIPNLLSVVRPLTKFAAGLPAYTRNTQRLSQTTLQIRNALFQAREPDQLLFVQLPKACGLAPFSANEEREPTEIEDFFKDIRTSLSELQRAYDDLRNEIEGRLVAAFSLKGRGEEGLAELKDRARPLLDLTVEPKLKSFIIRTVDDDIDVIGWIESIATFLTNKPPASWNDDDLARFEMSIAEISRSFLHIELLSFELRKRSVEASDSGNEIIRLGITTLNEPERQKVLAINDEERLLIKRAESSIEEALKSVGIEDNAELSLAVLAKLSKKLLDELEKKEPKKPNPKSDITKRVAKQA